MELNMLAKAFLLALIEFGAGFSLASVIIGTIIPLSLGLTCMMLLNLSTFTAVNFLVDLKI